MHTEPIDEEYQSPSGSCDLIMEGGITSGVVYPPAVLQLAKQYRFHNIGGASAGAIAAAMTAAAEHNRSKGGFRELGKVVGEFTGDVNAPATVRLFDLFQPTSELRPVLGWLMAGHQLANRRGSALFLFLADGGIVSNFPIHLFDRWLPEHPTFGINLAYLDPDSIVSREDDSGRVSSDCLSQATRKLPPATPRPAVVKPIHLPRADSECVLPWTKVESLSKFLLSIVDTARNHRDVMLSALPGYRERVVTIYLESGEGGYNLGMTPKTIQGIADRGTKAGQLLNQRFGPDGTAWDEHKWVRYQIVTALLERELLEMVPALKGDDFYKRLTAEAAAELPFKRGAEWLEEARRRTELLVKFLLEVYPAGVHFDDKKGPSPVPVKRFVPPDEGWVSLGSVDAVAAPAAVPQADAG